MEKNSQSDTLNPQTRRHGLNLQIFRRKQAKLRMNSLKKITYIIIAFLILGAGTAIPFYFESPSIYYKTGLDKFLLRAGKILGILATILIFFQLILISRFKKIEKVFQFRNIIQSHRRNGLILLGVAITHPILILGADHFVFFPIEFKYWPEFTGIGLLLLLFLFVVVSWWRQKIKLDYKLWKLIHKSFAPFILILLFIHIFNVSSTFESGTPLYALTVLFALSLVFIMRKHFKKL